MKASKITLKIKTMQTAKGIKRTRQETRKEETVAYEILRILDEREEDGQRQYKVAWKPTWVNAQDVLASRLVRQFERERAEEFFDDEAIEDTRH